MFTRLVYHTNKCSVKVKIEHLFDNICKYVL
nr:MAG TPA: hypothetical protein [Herelleviridae sp.]